MLKMFRNNRQYLPFKPDSFGETMAIFNGIVGFGLMVTAAFIHTDTFESLVQIGFGWVLMVQFLTIKGSMWEVKKNE